MQAPLPLRDHDDAGGRVPVPGRDGGSVAIDAGDDPSGGVDWREGGVPVSRRFADPYFSLAGGLAEAGHVFLAGNGLPGRIERDPSGGFQVAELGFGTGLNLLALGLAAPGRAFRYTSFEAFPLGVDEVARALSAFPAVAALAESLLEPWARGARRFRVGAIEVEVVVGDARETLPAWNADGTDRPTPALADAWFLDGFSPARNPELWSPSLMAEVARHTATGGTFATYTAAGHVRRSLEEAGFAVTRETGFGHKRHMTRGVLA